MDWHRLAPYLGWYTVLAAGVSMGIVFALAAVVGIAVPAVALVAALGAVVALALVLGTSDAGIETVSAGAAVGFGGGNPQRYQPDSMPIPGRLALVCYLLGVALVSVLTVAAFL